MPDPGVPLQLVHHDDVADAITLAATGSGQPGIYNLAADGEVSLSEVAAATGTRATRIPQAVATAASAILAKLPMVPAGAEWVHVARNSVVMDTTRASKILGWSPRFTSPETLDALASAF
jgi:UDP-glucose 4-epimerase